MLLYSSSEENERRACTHQAGGTGFGGTHGLQTVTLFSSFALPKLTFPHADLSSPLLGLSSLSPHLSVLFYPPPSHAHPLLPQLHLHPRPETMVKRFACHCYSSCVRPFLPSTPPISPLYETDTVWPTSQKGARGESSYQRTYPLPPSALIRPSLQLQLVN